MGVAHQATAYREEAERSRPLAALDWDVQPLLAALDWDASLDLP